MGAAARGLHRGGLRVDPAPDRPRFADLLERTEFMHRITRQDHSIIVAVKTAGTRQPPPRVDWPLEGRLQSTQSGVAAARAGKRAALHRIRSSRHKLEEDVRAMEAQQARIGGDLSGGAPIRRDSGRFTGTSPRSP